MRDTPTMPTPAFPEARLHVAAAHARVPRSESPFAQGVRRLRRSRTALAGGGIVALLLLTALFADVLAPSSPIRSDHTQTFERPTAAHPLGTDQLGRDMLSRIIHGSRVSLAVGVSSVLLALTVGVPLGLIAGYCGGRLDSVVMRAMDLILAFSVYLLAIVIMVIFTPTAGLLGTIKVIGAIAVVRVPIHLLVSGWADRAHPRSPPAEGHLPDTSGSGPRPGATGLVREVRDEHVAVGGLAKDARRSDPERRRKTAARGRTEDEIRGSPTGRTRRLATTTSGDRPGVPGP